MSLEGLASGTGANPVLFRVDIKSRHGANSTTKAIKLAAHIHPIVFYNLESRRDARGSSQELNG